MVHREFQFLEVAPKPKGKQRRVPTRATDLFNLTLFHGKFVSLPGEEVPDHSLSLLLLLQAGLSKSCPANG